MVQVESAGVQRDASTGGYRKLFPPQLVHVDVGIVVEAVERSQLHRVEPRPQLHRGLEVEAVGMEPYLLDVELREVHGIVAQIAEEQLPHQQLRAEVAVEVRGQRPREQGERLIGEVVFHELRRSLRRPVTHQLLAR